MKKSIWCLLLVLATTPVAAETLKEATERIINETETYVDTVTTRVFCPECQETGDKSKVYIKGSYYIDNAWSGGYYGEDGFFVPVQFNGENVTLYECSRGHSFEGAR